MVDPERVKALAKQPARRFISEGGGGDGDLLRVVSGLRYERGPLAKPVLWSTARCVGESHRLDARAVEGAGEEMKRICRTCPIRDDCSTAVLAGAPVQVRRWRERMDGGYPLME